MKTTLQIASAELTRAATSSRNADWQSAVSPVGNRQRWRMPRVAVFQGTVLESLMQPCELTKRILFDVPNKSEPRYLGCYCYVGDRATVFIISLT